nr:PREDICTED: unconventional myosin-IXb isoform X2 [Latimeria chalumnae]|eukprot:XP_006006188.1 PREDICTED: unconventional myosin-IXb isoform X2 [Latimeria chalumnae]
MSRSDDKSARSHVGRTYSLCIYPRLSAVISTCCSVLASKEDTSADVIKKVVALLGLDSSKNYVLAEVKESGGEEWVLEGNDSPVQRVLLWPRRAHEDHPQNEGYHFLLQERNTDGSIRYVHLQSVSKEKEDRRLVERGFLPRQQEDYDDLCNLPKLTENTILENLKTRFLKHKIYTYAGSILIAINPFKFLPIYNPKYVKMYDNHTLGKLEPHIFAIADVAYHTMLRNHVNQCIVISGESGSGKTQSTNFLIHCLTALSQKGYASGVERTILGAGPVLEVFGNAKTAHNNNSSRFGKFIQVSYLESGIVRGAVVEKYLLEKSRLVSQEKDERNYHVFYYLLLGASEQERVEFNLKQPQHFAYLNQHNFQIDDGEELRHDFERLKQAMEMVGFLPATKKQIFSVLSAILYLGNVTYKKKASGRDEGLEVGPPEVLTTLSQLLKVKQEMLVEALTKRKTVTVNEKLILPYSLNEAITARDSMAKSLYSALFDWIVLRINHALLNKKDMEESVTCLSIGVLDIFGFEDFEINSFEQFCINYANEQLQYYFNQHIFKLEQEEYQSEGISWHNIDYTDNVGCIHLISKKPTGLFYLLDEESNFPHATNQTLLAKFKQQHEGNNFFVGTPVMEPAFVIHHFAGKVKYQIKDFREKNMDYMRPDIVALLRSSDSAYIRELIGMDPVAVFRWAILRATIRAMAVFREAGRQRAEKTAGVIRRGSRVPLGELQRANTPIEKVYRKTKGTKQKQTIPKNLLDSMSLKLIVSLTLHDRTTKSLLHLHKKKKPPSISAQFQNSLSKLMENLEKAEPFFIRCIRSNAEKKELHFNESLVVQQLRYTGMLETVRIRRSGYSAKYSFQEFVDQFQVLLPKNSQPSQELFSMLFEKTGLDKNNYQIGKTKVFMKEAERQQLQDTLHKEVMRKIIVLQSWFRVALERKQFLRMRQAAITIQKIWHSYCARRSAQENNAATVIQAAWRGYWQCRDYKQQLKRLHHLQAVCRGYLTRRRFQVQQEEKRKLDEVAKNLAKENAEAEKKGQNNPSISRIPEVSKGDDITPEIKGTVSPSEKEGKEKDGEGSETSQLTTDPPKQPLLSQKSLSVDSLDKMARKRETRRQRGLEHDKLQNMRAWSPCQEIEPFGSISAGSKDTNGAATENELQVVQEQSKDAQRYLTEGQHNDKGLPANGEVLETKATDSIPKMNSNQVGEAELKEPSPKRKQDGGNKPAHRPSSLPLSVIGDVQSEATTEEQALLSKDMGKQDKDQRSPEEPESPTSAAIQRYNDQEKLRNMGEKWKVKRKSDTMQIEVPFPSPEKKEQEKRKEAPSPKPVTGTKGISASLNDISQLLIPGSETSMTLTPTKETPVEPTAAEEGKSHKKQPVQKKRSQEGPTHQDAAAAFQPQTQPDRSALSPFRRLIERRKDKKTSKDGLQPPEDGEILTFAQAVNDVVVMSRVTDVPLAHSSRTLPMDPVSKVRRNPSIRISNATTVAEQWNTSVREEITNANELKHLDDFLLNKVNDLDSLGNQKSGIEFLFVRATEKFRERIKTMYSVPNEQTHVRYKDLMDHFQLLVKNLTQEKKENCDGKLVVNLFQSLLDEFTRGYTRREDLEPAKLSKSQKKRRKRNQLREEYNGHVFSNYQVTIVQSCEQCSSYIWGMEKALVCSACKMTCHKKCMPKIQYHCPVSCGKKSESEGSSRHFGVLVCALTNEKNSVPLVLEKLLEYVEMHGLYTEGIYRKSGVANRMKELRNSLETDPNLVRLENYPIHAITGILKQWLRELPDPLMTFSLYSDFLRAVELPGKEEQQQGIYSILEQLPPANYSTLERLIFHLVKVALLEETNRMSPNALAIVFAPCLLRCPDNADPLISMKDVSKTTMCIEMLIQEQMRKYQEKMDKISQLEAAEVAVRRLSLSGHTRLWLPELRFSTPYKGLLNKSPKVLKTGEKSPGGDLGSVQEEDEADDQDKEMLIARIQSIKDEKDEITYRLPELYQRVSDEENLDSETSVSTESLLEDRTGQSDSEEAVQNRSQSPSQRQSTSHAASPSTMKLPPSMDFSNPMQPHKTLPRRPVSMLANARLPLRNPAMPMFNIKLPPGMLPSSESQKRATSASTLLLVRHREPPARRSDHVQSMYFSPREEVQQNGLENSEDYEPNAKLQRRFSDPLSRVPCTEEL